MLLLLNKMGCGRSKNQSPTYVGQDLDMNGATKERGAAKKKKFKGDKKENKDPLKGLDNCDGTPASPIKSTTLTPPLMTLNGSSQQTLNIDVEYPFYKEKGDKTVSVPSKTKDGKELGKQTSIRVTHSQLEFFKMLDEKIEKGYEYSSEDESSTMSSP